MRQFASNVGKTFKRRHVTLDDNTGFWNAKIDFSNGEIKQFYDFAAMLSTNKSSWYMHSEFDCGNLEKQEILLHEIMTRISETLGISVSLIDFAKLFRVEPYREEIHRYVSSYPYFSWCNYGKIIGHIYQKFVGGKRI